MPIFHPTSTTTNSIPNAVTNDKSTIEFIFLGTGTSSSLPHIECLTDNDGVRPPCKTCLSTLRPEGKKNIRRNTSAAVRMQAKDGQVVTIVIDAGKNFQAAALEWFPRYSLRKIDALLITHPHADAMNGLDDLRGWTLSGAIQSHIDIYLSQDTFKEVQRSFPYLTAKEYASGGGDECRFDPVPEFKWHIIKDKTPFEIQGTGIMITPFLVHHGRVFSVAPPPGHISTPGATLPSTPTNSIFALPTRAATPSEVAKQDEDEEIVHPYFCFGFKIQNDVVYMSDVSHVPDDVWPILESSDDAEPRRLPVAVLDCLNLRSHTSHFGLAESVAAARRINATRTYLTGFSHRVSHEEYVTIGEILGGAEQNEDGLTDMERKGVGLVGEERGLWLRPAHDGLRIFIDDKEGVKDETYY